jgi:uncharacterized protein
MLACPRRWRDGRRWDAATVSRLFLALSLLPAAAVLASVVLRRRRGGRHRWYVTAVAALAGLLVALLLAWVAGANGAGMVHVLYLTATVGVPASAAVLVVDELSRGRAARPLCVAGLTLAALVLAGLGVYGTYIEPFRLRMERASLDVAGVGSGSVRLAVYADPHMAGLSSHESGAWQRLMAEGPDVVLLAGDLFTGPFEVVRSDVRGFRRLLDACPVPVLAVAGDHDQVTTLEWLARGTATDVLDGEVVQLTVGDITLAVAGLDRDLTADRSEAALRALAASDVDVRIVLAHDPTAALLVRGAHRVDLVVAGDTHGGQVRLPLIGPLVNSSRVPDDVAAGGLHQVDGTSVYVSRGVGVARGQAPQVRLGAPPAVDVITLR